MSCWCEKTHYVCLDCEAHKSFEKMHPVDQARLQEYCYLLERDILDIEKQEHRLLAQWCLRHDLGPEMLPDQKRWTD